MSFTVILKKLGLQDKEIHVYLAALASGPSSVQFLARKAGVARATTYVVLKNLEQKKLITHFQVGKKTYFEAEHPRQILEIIEAEEETVRQKGDVMRSVLPALEAIMKRSSGEPYVQYFPGREGLEFVRRELIRLCSAKDVWRTFYSADSVKKILESKEQVFINQRKAKRIRARELFTANSPAAKEELLTKMKADLSYRKYVTLDDNQNNGGIIICINRVVLESYDHNLGAVMIENKGTAGMCAQLFDLIWKRL